LCYINRVERTKITHTYSSHDDTIGWITWLVNTNNRQLEVAK